MLSMDFSYQNNEVMVDKSPTLIFFTKLFATHTFRTKYESINPSLQYCCVESEICRVKCSINSLFGYLFLSLSIDGHD